MGFGPGRRSIAIGLCVLAARAGEPAPRLGAPGESCTARNDCAEGLACLRSVCVPVGASFTVTGKDCYRIECEADGDCCADFTPSADCDFYQMRCEADPMDCAGFRTLCQCNDLCVEQRCANAGPACMLDTDCPSFSTPFCTAGRCVECREHADCTFEGDRCVDGACARGCLGPDDCPALHGCEAGRCVPAPCSSARECAFALGDARGRCTGGSCSLACTDDLECDVSRFEVCHDAECRFAGCETDAECRALFGSALTDGARAVCR